MQGDNAQCKTAYTVPQKMDTRASAIPPNGPKKRTAKKQKIPFCGLQKRHFSQRYGPGSGFALVAVVAVTGQNN
jgi:hypothetical protein